MKKVQITTTLSAIVAFGWLAVPAFYLPGAADSEAQFQASSSAVTTSTTEQGRESSTQSSTQNGDEAARHNSTSSSFEGRGPASTSAENLRNPRDLSPPKANLWGTNQNAWGTTPDGTPALANVKEKAKTKSVSITQAPRARVYATGYRMRRIVPSHQVLVQSKTRTTKYAYRNSNRVQ
jgi:hypothetical protein